MLFRAIFWIGLVSLLMPHEPDLGFGRPQLAAPLPDGVQSRAAQDARASAGICERNAPACSTGMGFFDRLQSAAVRSLADVKNEIEQNQRERLLHTNAS
jgi:hypothetical protein